jgi:hypothetical protein
MKTVSSILVIILFGLIGYRSYLILTAGVPLDSADYLVLAAATYLLNAIVTIWNDSAASKIANKTFNIDENSPRH